MSKDQQTQETRRESSTEQIASFGLFSLPDIRSPYSLLISTSFFPKLSFTAHISLSPQPEHALSVHPFLSRWFPQAVAQDPRLAGSVTSLPLRTTIIDLSTTERLKKDEPTLFKHSGKKKTQIWTPLIFRNLGLRGREGKGGKRIINHVS